MNPFTMLTLGAHLMGVYFDEHPQLLLSMKCERRIGESEFQYQVREFRRLDAIMRRMIANGERSAARAAERVKRGDELLQQALEVQAKRQAEAEALKALGGGIADHPKASFTAVLSPEQLKADAERRAKQEKAIAELEADLIKQAAKDPAYQKILDDFREDIRKAREVGTTKPGK